jgi:hypothetical protein
VTVVGGAGGGATGGAAGAAAPTGGGGAGGPGGASGGSIGPPFDPTTDPNCQIEPASWHEYTTEAELDALLVRRWKRCNDIQLKGEDVGVEFTADGHFYPLTWAADGSVARRTGSYEGSWIYYPIGSSIPDLRTTSSTAPVFRLSGVAFGGEYTSVPQITDDPRQMRILFSPAPSKYVPLDPMPGDGLVAPGADGGTAAGDGGGAVVVRDASSTFDPRTDPSCTASPASLQTYTTGLELQALLVGAWRSCASGTPGDLGLEFTADGHFYPLTNGPNGSIVRRTGVDFEGSWQYVPPGAADPFTQMTLTRGIMIVDGQEAQAPQLTNDPRQLIESFTGFRGFTGALPRKLIPFGP